MITPPETRYARSGGAHIAYQAIGTGPPDIVILPPWVSHVEAYWDHPVMARPLRRFASYARLILFDRRGIGLSDPVPLTEVPSLEGWMDDLLAVLDAVGCERAVLLGTGDGAQMALTFAATHPRRTESLVLVNGYARLARADDYPWGVPVEVQDRIAAIQEETWGVPSSPSIDLLAPSLAGDQTVRHWWARLERLACSPGTAVAMQRAMYGYDVRHVLPAVTAPTLVLHSTGDRVVRVGHGRYLAQHIPGARHREFPGADHWYWVGDQGEPMMAAVHEFAIGTTVAPVSHRVLATVLFTDVVASTETADALGDRAWGEVLDDLDDLVAAQVERFRGTLVKSLGDGHLATFDGPGRAIRCAMAIRNAVGSLGIEVRAGLHTGEIELRGHDPAGIAVHIAARVVGLAGAGEVLVSASVPPLVAGAGFTFADRGEQQLRGVPGSWRVFAVTDEGRPHLDP
ncbi:MAG: adenylate/guanylate cyclase domain-containing protein [Actinobacteria bacterium]|nr:adenylate/guanylate cyclase domain-containing protein [Actinomycetota bacterium]